MKLVFSKTNLAKAVGIVMKAVPAKTTMNILECILIDATTNEIKFTANDMELGIETIVEGEIIEKGKKSLVVATGDGAISLKTVQPAGKPRMNIVDFLNGVGRKLEVGDLIGE